MQERYGITIKEIQQRHGVTQGQLNTFIYKHKDFPPQIGRIPTPKGGTNRPKSLYCPAAVAAYLQNKGFPGLEHIEFIQIEKRQNFNDMAQQFIRSASWWMPQFDNSEPAETVTVKVHYDKWVW